MSASSPRAFTLIEAMLTVVVVGVLLAAGLPALSDAIEAQKVRAATASVPRQLELILKEGRNRMVPVLLQVKEDGIYYQFNPQARIAITVNACAGGHNSACNLRQPSCAFLEAFHDSICVPMQGAASSMMREGDIDGLMDIWRVGAATCRPLVDFTGDFGAGPDMFGVVTERLAAPPLRFADKIPGTGLEASFCVTPLGRVAGTGNGRRVAMIEPSGRERIMEILDSGIVRVLP
jgi:prepilin-type N-terminal cleavage/methylation domain-containing protein